MRRARDLVIDPKIKTGIVPGGLVLGVLYRSDVVVGLLGFCDAEEVAPDCVLRAGHLMDKVWTLGTCFGGESCRREYNEVISRDSDCVLYYGG